MKSQKFSYSLLLVMLLSMSPLSSQENTELPLGGSAFDNIDRSRPSDREGYDPIPSMPENSRDRQELSSFTNKTTIKQRSPYYAGFQFGAAYGQFETSPYTDIIITPYMQIGPFFLGYEVPLRFDWYQSFITSVWDSPEAAISKIKMNLYYEQTNSFFRFIQAEISEKQNIYQGHGRFFHDYNANQYSPYEVVKSFNFALDLSYVTLNYTLANIASPSLMGTEVAIRPLAWINNEKYAFYRNFRIYGVWGLDLSSYHGYYIGLYNFAEADNRKNSPKTSMIELGAEIPIFEVKDKFNLTAYGDYAKISADSKNKLIVNAGSGVSYGLIMTIMDLMPIRFEMSHAQGHWAPRWVNKFYNIDRVYIDDGISFKANKALSITPNLIYYNTSIGIDWKTRVFFNAEVFGDTAMNDLWLTLSLKLGKELLRFFTMDLAVSMRGLVNGRSTIINHNNFIMELDFKYHMLPNMYWGLQWKYSAIVGDVHDGSAFTSTLGTKPFHTLGLNFSFQF
ncbi:MAG: hypothetical protein ACRCS8_06355 [Brevinema sp.]